MEDLREMQVKEAVKRMKALHILPRVIQEFKGGTINKSEKMGLLYWLDDEEKEMVKKFEEKREGVVYHVIMTDTTIGRMYSLLYVSKHTEEWEMDRAEIQQMVPFVYVVNKDMPVCSDFGRISIIATNGGLVRVG